MAMFFATFGNPKYYEISEANYITLFSFFTKSEQNNFALKTNPFIAGKKNPAIQKKKLFVFPLKISLKTSVCMH